MIVIVRLFPLLPCRPSRPLQGLDFDPKEDFSQVQLGYSNLCDRQATIPDRLEMLQAQGVIVEISEQSVPATASANGPVPERRLDLWSTICRL